MNNAMTKAAQTNPATVEYRRIPHAAHYAGMRGGHDLEEWTYAQPERLPLPETVAPGAEFSRGFRDRHGVQHWVYSRIAPLTAGGCDRCQKEAR